MGRWSLPWRRAGTARFVQADSDSQPKAERPGFEPPIELRADRVTGGTLVANRNELIRALAQRIGPRPRVVEVGVGLGDFSEFLIRCLNPSMFWAIDIFRMHHMEWIWGRKGSEVFQGLTHLEFYQRRFQGLIQENRLGIVEGLSWESLKALPAADFDLIYVDAAHDFASVSRDLEASLRCLRQDGVIVANDYTLYDPYLQLPHGVVQAINMFVEQHDLKVDCFALEKNMFCDIAISRRT
jgi:hypothetical protein